MEWVIKVGGGGGGRGKLQYNQPGGVRAQHPVKHLLGKGHGARGLMGSGSRA